MRKLIATFDYQGSADEPVYRRVEVHRIEAGHLGGLETVRDVSYPEIYPYKSYLLRQIHNLRITNEEVAPRLTVSDELRLLAAKLEGK
jgi:hypothetical protein